MSFFIWSWRLYILTDNFLIAMIKIGSRETLVPNTEVSVYQAQKNTFYIQS